jgi:hypothetical protein
MYPRQMAKRVLACCRDRYRAGNRGICRIDAGYCHRKRIGAGSIYTAEQGVPCHEPAITKDQPMRAFNLPSILFLVVFVATPVARAQEKPSQDQPALWLYTPTNLLPAENIDKLEKLWRHAAAAGYTHILLADSKFSRLDQMPREYFGHCDRLKQLARELKLEIIPAEFPVGYSNDLLSNDPSLAEGLPVIDTPFVVQSGEARCEPDPSVTLKKIAFKDDVVKIQENIATIDDNKENARFVYHLAVPKFRCYHVSVQIKTRDYTGHPQIAVLAAGDRALNHENLRVKPTQDWTASDIVFDTLDNKELNLYFGVWGETKGELQWKDWKIEEIGLVNVLRRKGAPCTVKDSSGKTLIEGRDYQPIADPHMGTVPYAGEYQSWHEPPVIKTNLPDGTKLQVSWYYPPIVYDGQVAACISAPRTMELLADQSRRMKQLWAAKGYMMSHDEFRCCNWDLSCEQRHQTPGKMLAENIRACTKLVNPEQAYTWNDMFDPYHNAVKGPYYLVNGPWTGSWEGLDKSVIILNWNYGKRDESLRFFADRGNRQVLCGYYDGPLSDWRNWLTSGAKVHGIVGYMYTTWQNNFDHIEEFAKMARQAH